MDTARQTNFPSDIQFLVGLHFIEQTLDDGVRTHARGLGVEGRGDAVAHHGEGHRLHVLRDDVGTPLEDRPRLRGEDEIGIYRAETGATDVKLEKILDAEEILKLQEVVRRVPVADHVLEYAADLVRATRPKDPSAPEFIKEMVAWGAGPRAGLSLILAAKARAILEGRPYVITKDVKAMALPVMRHRISTTFNAEAAGVTADSIVTRLVDEIKGHEELDV